MMAEQTQSFNLPSGNFMAKPAEPEIMMNSQGERIEFQKPIQTQEQISTLSSNFDDVISLADTDLAQSVALYPATDDTGIEHRILSCGHVLKSTHDLARWSEKTGARRVNQLDSIDLLTDLAVNLEPNKTRTPRTNTTPKSNNADPTGDISGLFGERASKGGRRQRAQKWQPVEGQKSEVIKCWPVLKSTHDAAQMSEKRGRRAVNQAECSESLDELATNQSMGGQQGTSEILQSWPVLKSTHDQATWSEKKGSHAVNNDAGSEALEELALNKLPGQMDAPSEPSSVINSWPVLKSTHDEATWSEKDSINDFGSVCVLEEVAKSAQQAGGSLQSGMDTQTASHVQLDTKQSLSETPEQVMADLHVHV